MKGTDECIKAHVSVKINHAGCVYYGHKSCSMANNSILHRRKLQHMCMYFSTYYIVNIKILSPGLRAFKDNTKITVTWTILSGVPPTLGVKQPIDLMMVDVG